MKKAEFVELLRQELAVLPQGELDKHLNYFEELINDMMDDGMSEEEATARLGDPSQAAKQILESMPNPPKPTFRPEKANVKKVSFWMALGLILSSPLWITLLAVGVAVIVTVVVVVLAVLAAVCAVVLALIVGGIGMIVASFLTVGTSAATGAVMVGVGLLCVGLGILAGFAVAGLVKLLRWAACKMKEAHARRKNL